MSLTTDEPSYVPFELLVGAKTPSGYPVTVLESPAGDGEALCHLDSNGELQDALQFLEEGSTDEGFLAELGAFLFDELFSGEVSTLYHTSLGMARSQSKRLRVRLRFTPPELAALPWEYLYDLQEDAFLAISPETALVRYVPVRLPVRPTAVSPPLRVLCVISNPLDARPLDVEQEKAILQDALAEWVDEGRVQVEFVEHATVPNIMQAIRRMQPHVFHFIGHGLFQHDEAFLLLQNDASLAHPIDARSFREFFSGAKEMRLAVLNACQSATVSTSQPLVGLAPKLLQRQLSAVVAMQYPIPDQTLLVFSREFYRSLALGYPVDAAISEARRGIFLESGMDSPSWGAPVLFLRAKHGQLFQTEETEAGGLQVPPPPEPARPPTIVDFVGREAELTYFHEILQSAHIAIIAGMAGLGKTSLAVKLAQRVAVDPDKVFWHSFHEGQGIDATIWSLAGFLAWHGRDDLWKLLQSIRQTGGQPPPAETLFDYVLQLVRGGDFMLCFDDFHHVDTDPLLNELVERLGSAISAGDLWIIITTRRVPDFVKVVEFAPIEGLSETDAFQLLQSRDVQLTPQQFESLYGATKGNATFLILVADALKRARNPDRLLTRLARSRDLERYLLQEVDEGLTEAERSVMITVATLLGYPGTRDAIELVLDQGNIWRTLRRLTERHLLIVQDGESGREYLAHDIVRAFYYEQAGSRQRREMHRRAGAYYDTEEPDLHRASLHHERAGDYERAAQLATQDVRGLINQGQARALLNLLERLPAAHLEPRLWAEVNLARGEIYSMLNDKDRARECLAEAYEKAIGLSDEASSDNLEARICLALGRLLGLEAPREALDWLRQGLEAAGGKDCLVAAELQIEMGYLMMQLGDYDDASNAVEQGLGCLPEGPSKLRSLALLQLGSICSRQRQSELCQDYTVRALEIAEQIHDYFQMLYCLINLAIDKSTAGQWRDAISDFQEAAALAERLGHEKSRTFLELNLGVVKLLTGDNGNAQRHLLRCLEMAREKNDRLVQVVAQTNLASLWLRAGDLDMAHEALHSAERLAVKINARHSLIEIYKTQAELHLAMDLVPASLDHAERAVQLAEELGAESGQGACYRVWGRALFADGQQQQAVAKFDQSLALLEHDPYERAQTQMHYGQVLVSCGDENGGAALIDQARQAFQQLQAEFDLAELEALAAGVRD